MKIQEDSPAMARQKIIRSKEQSSRSLSQTSADPKKASRDSDAPNGLARAKTFRLADDVERLRADFDSYVTESRLELQRLSRRVYQLEQLAKRRLRTEPDTDSTRAPTSSARSLFTFLGRPTFPSLS